jgi:hypothetical protein
MSTIVPFEAQSRAGLSLKRRSLLMHGPLESMEPDEALQFEQPSGAPYGQAALQAAWDKLYRARAILEAEQAHLRDDRLSIQGELEALDERTRAVEARELRIQQLEMKAALEKADLEEAQEEKDSQSAISKLTRAPFDIARSVFGPKK